MTLEMKLKLKRCLWTAPLNSLKQMTEFLELTLRYRESYRNIEGQSHLDVTRVAV